ncbi:MAG: hypothetical protein HDQ88_07930, partial [Clostridia bacterium]|nr:hypothetical protein [Clostridia bacterium]
NGDNPDIVDYGNPAEDGYIIKLVYPDGSAVKGSDCNNPAIPAQARRVRVRLLDDNNQAIPNASAVVDESGNGAINYTVPGVYTIDVQQAPLGYTYDKTTTTADRAYYTIQLKVAPPTEYTVNVQYNSGLPATNIGVSLLDGEEVVATATTDSDGKAVTAEKIERGAYKVVLDIPATYTYPTTYTAISALPVDITLNEANAITFEEKDRLTEEAAERWNNAFNSEQFTRLDLSGDVYSYSADLVDLDQEVFFTITAPETGNYLIAAMSEDYTIKFYYNDLSGYDSRLTIDSRTNNGKNIQQMRIVEGETLTFSCATRTGNPGKVDFLVLMPLPAPETTQATTEGTYTLTYRNFSTAILDFTPAQSGIYKITSSTNDYDVFMVVYAYGLPVASDDENDLPQGYNQYKGDDNSGEGNNFSYTETVRASYVGNTYSYHVTIKETDLQYPLQLQIKVERVGDAPIEVEIPVETATTNVNTQYIKPAGNFTWMPTDGSVEIVVEDGLYYAMIGGNKKPIVMAVTKELNGQEYSFATIEYQGEPESGDTSGSSGGRANNYLTVFKDFATKDTKVNYTSFIEQYAQYADEDDGVYEVNEELHTFLVRYMDQRYTDFTESTQKPEVAWLIGCGYYA